MKKSLTYPFLFLIIISGIIISIKMQGTTTILENNIEPQKDISLKCASGSYIYPFFTYDEADKKVIEITMLFKETLLYSIFLKQSLYYDSHERAVGSEAHNHAAINISFKKNGLKADALNAKYSIMENSMQFVLYETRDNFIPVLARYFLLDSELDVINIDEVQQVYEQQGLTCLRD